MLCFLKQGMAKFWTLRCQGKFLMQLSECTHKGRGYALLCSIILHPGWNTEVRAGFWAITLEPTGLMLRMRAKQERSVKSHTSTGLLSSRPLCNRKINFYLVWSTIIFCFLWYQAEPNSNIQNSSLSVRFSPTFKDYVSCSCFIFPQHLHSYLLLNSKLLEGHWGQIS